MIVFVEKIIFWYYTETVSNSWSNKIPKVEKPNQSTLVVISIGSLQAFTL